MDLMKENQPVPVNATWNSNGTDGLDLLLKVAQTTAQPKQGGVKKSKAPSMVLNGSYSAPVIVGRGSQATLNLGRINKQVSRRHAIVEWCSTSAVFQITVLGQNGVRINGVGYPSGQQATLQEGDIVDLVGVKMLFRKPAGASPVQAFRDLDSELFEDDLESISASSRLMSPTRDFDFYHAKQLASPTRSSPIRDTPVTPTARMRHKVFKYDLSSTNKTPFDSPPPSSDGITEYGSSPVRSRPLFVMPDDASPVRRPIGLESPNSEPNIFLVDQPQKSPLKSPSKRSPLAPLSLKEGIQANTVRPQVNVDRSSMDPSSPLKLKSVASAKTTSKSGTDNRTKALPLTHKQRQSGIQQENEENRKPVAVKKESSKAINDSSKKVDKSARPPSTTPASKTQETSKSSTKVDEVATKTGPTNSLPPTTAEPALEEQTKAGVAVSAENDDELSPLSSSLESSPEPNTAKSPVDYTEMIIDTLVFARKKKSMTLTELFEDMIASQPSLMSTQDSEEIKEQMLQCLTAARCVGKITRKGKDAYNKPLENQWYYIPECDHNVMRKQTRQEVMPSARKCTLKDKQYFFKMPPKLPYHRKSTSPYAVKPSARRAKEPSKLSAGADEDVADDGSSSSDAEDDTDVASQLATRKRKMANGASMEKKRKGFVGILDQAHAAKVDNNNDDDDDEDNGVENDSLDDLSELSGLSD
ncbi:hypothetical protein BGZ98_005071 [Dissophora globulifera]|nr:hypothetical protein BGZ98_005071 [Dissophora globulifera]